MQKQVSLIVVLLGCVCSPATGQGVFVYDQESVPSDYWTGETGYSITGSQPIGQSFTPDLSSIGFVRLQMFDETPNNSLGSTVQVNLWAGSIEGNGELLGSTASVFLPDGFGHGGTSSTASLVNFYFTIPIVLTPGRTYLLQPVIQSGDDVVVNGNFFNHSGGSLIANGMAQLQDLWFREGVYLVPEPSPVWLLLVGSMVFGFLAHCRRARTVSER